ncbi:uncharacterized protein LOC111801768 isoform X1 [Cucurbita pepo subsp. pepo]|uniref:uncharacterized protein LOC111801768 isoform X1 n=2 Tax=Cucurbita pepo subsp. pepo TaxID=3664 RepID=UPI000C9D727C|nr:uncharacterized protein LOC111801768 isoform X1 [Cucurbita pepo subsp. pepo]
MASTPSTCSPNSLQLRLALNCKNSPKFPFLPVRATVRKLDPRLRVISRPIVHNSAKIARTNGLRRNEICFAGSDSKADGFSGWSESDSGEEDLNLRRKNWLAGLVGIGITGFILVSGITFAAWSINKQNCSRQKAQMEALSTHQQLLLDSDSGNDKLGEDQKEDNSVNADDVNHEEFSSYTENDEALNKNRVGDVAVVEELSGNDVESSSNNDNVNNVAFLQEDIQSDSLLAVTSVAYGSSEIDSDVDSGFKDVNSGTEVLTSEPEMNDEPDNSPETKYDFSSEKFPVYDDSSSNYNSGYQDETADPPVNGIDDSSLHELGLVDEETVTESLEGVLNPGKTEQLLSEETGSTIEQQIGRGLSEAAFVSVTAYPLADDQEQNHETTVNSSAAEPELQGNLFSSAGVPAPLVSAAVKTLPGKVLVPAVVDQVQGQALAALQVLKVIESEVEPSGLCTRREYARWLVSASCALSRNTASKVYPAMYIENVTELAFDDITPEDPDFASIQGLAEAGLISSKLSRHDILSSLDDDEGPFYFSPESPLSRQDLVSWKMALEKRQLPEADRKTLHQVSGFIDTDKIHPDACPALVADLSVGEHGIIALAFGYTRLFQPDKPVTKAQAAIALAIGEASDIVSEELARIEAESMAENAVAAHSALVAQVEKDINASFEKELSIEREKADAVEKMAEEAKQELERLRYERERDNIALMKERAAIESEMEVLSRLRNELEEQLQGLMSNKVEVSYEKERINKLRKEAEIENQEISRLQYELEVERKALSMARSWAEEEAKRAREQAKALEEARDRWEKQGIKVVVDSDLREEESAGDTWLDSSKQFAVEETVDRAENLMDKLKGMGREVRGKSKDIIEMIIQKIAVLISNLRQWVRNAGEKAEDVKNVGIARASRSATELQQSSAEMGLALKEGAKRVVGDCREGVEKISQKFRTSYG